MHIQRQTSTELVLQDGSMWMAFLFVPAAFFGGVAAIEKHKPMGLLISAFFLLFAAAFTRHTTFTLDGMQRVARFRRRTFLKIETGSIPFDSISDIVIDAQAGDRNSVSYRLSLVTGDGPVPMANVFSGGSYEHVQHLREDILQFIGLGSGLPAPEPGILSDGISADIEASVRSLLARGRKIDAVSLVRAQQDLGLTDAVSRVDALAEKMKSSA
ncbi:MAG TPA: hypothetical protein VKR52_10480 [Terracidiphilus sp.]|nr:hypothetical protein [Terracidiphilus sp.]